jgi:hypothetical protein
MTIEAEISTLRGFLAEITVVDKTGKESSLDLDVNLLLLQTNCRINRQTFMVFVVFHHLVNVPLLYFPFFALTNFS